MSSNETKLVYLAGPINHLTYEEANRWRCNASDELRKWDIETLNPLRLKKVLLPSGILTDSYSHPFVSDSGIAVRDRLDVKRSSVILANFLGATVVSSGTPIEFGWADILGIPIVMVIEKTGNPFDHPMIRHIAGIRVDNLDFGIEAVRFLLSEGSEV